MLADFPAILILVGIAAYIVLAGADFGAGLWYLLAGPKSRGRPVRDFTYHAMAPVWEANHVWLIFVLVVTWTAYPTAFGSIFSTLAAALFIAGIGIVMRGTAYVIRSGASPERESERAAGFTFGASSVLTPFALGAAIGGIASGRVPVGNATGDLITSWLNPTSITIGVLAVASSGYLAAVYLAADATRAGEAELAHAFRLRALVTGVASGALAIAGLVVLREDARPLFDDLTTGAGVVAVIASGIAGVATLSLVRAERYEAARVSAALAVAAIVAGWGIAQSPDILPGLTIHEAAASHATLVALLISIAAGLVILVPSLVLLFGLVLRGRFDAPAPAVDGATAAALGPRRSVLRCHRRRAVHRRHGADCSRRGRDPCDRRDRPGRVHRHRRGRAVAPRRARTVTDAAPSPDAPLAPLDPRQLEQLRSYGHDWGPARIGDEVALPVDPSLHRASRIAGPTRWGRFVHVQPRGQLREELEATPADGPLGRVRRVLVGPPIRSSAVTSERMRKVVAMPVLSADALSSVAYGPEAIIAVLVLAGGAGLAWSLPIAGAIACMILAVGISYRQTIRAYPHGGGSYIVASENLGRVAGLFAAAGLVTDYILTVTISTAAGVDAVSSAVPSLRSEAVPIGIGAITLLLLGNLRGVRQAAGLFAAPTYLFISAIATLVIVGLVDAASRGWHATPHPTAHATQGVGVVLVLRAFASGATAMTGVEAISNAVPAFKPVEWRNARVTLSWMLALLLAMFAGIVALLHLDGLVPDPHETMLSQLAHRHFGGVLYACTQATTVLILLFAANTAFNDFPRVLYLLARDRFVARRYLRLGDRLAFSNGMIALSVAASGLFVVFDGHTQSLIPLYAVGVFLAFTLSQAGMMVHWWRQRGNQWRTSLLCNGFGCVCSATVLAIAAVTKFIEGAWVAVAIVLLFTGTSMLVRCHFERVNDALAFRPRTFAQDAEGEETPQQISNVGIVPVPALNRATLRALAYASSVCPSVLALHVAPTEAEGDRFQRYWAAWGNHVRLEVIQSPYRATVPPMIAYIEALHAQRPDLTLTVVVPELVVRHWWQRGLHDSDATRLRRALRPLSKIVVTSVPFHV